MGKILESILGISDSEESETVEEQFEVIVNELNDHEDKLFIWQFPGLTTPELEELYENTLEDIVVYGMKSEHVFVNSEIDIDELIVDEEHIVRARDKVFEKLSEEEE